MTRWQRIEGNMEIAIREEQNTSVLDRYAHVDWQNYRFDMCNTALDPIGPIYPVDVFAALKFTRGNYRQAAHLLNRPRDSLIRWLKANSEFNIVAVDEEEGALDDIETIARDQALAGDGAQVRFLLSTKAKNRGYSTKVENSGRIGIELEFDRIVATRMTEEQVMRMAEEIMARNKEQENTIDGTVVDAEES